VPHRFYYNITLKFDKILSFVIFTIVHKIGYKEVEKVEIKEIKAEDLDPEKFIEEKISEIREIVGDAEAIVALSGGVDSSITTVLAQKALGDKLKIVFIENGLMREDEAQQVVATFRKLGIHVEVIDAQEEFFAELKGKGDPEKKRKAITKVFYEIVLARLAKEIGAKFVLHGTIKTDIEETVAGIKHQHNILEQLGIDTWKEYGYKIIEPLKQLRKDGVKIVAKALGLPESIWKRMPFPGPALATRILGEVTRERVEIVRKATAIVEEELKDTGAFQVMAILHKDRVTGVRNGKRAFGLQIEVRAWDSVDARTAKPTKLDDKTEKRLAQRITTEIPEVVSVTKNITTKPPSTMEAT